MKRILIQDLHAHIGEEVFCAGFVSVRRDHGKLIFLDIRDETGTVQAVVIPQQKTAHDVANKLRPEWVIRAKGLIKNRPEKMINEAHSNGDIEMELLDIEILNEAETPAIEICGEGYEIGEESRLEHRYLDLRRPRLQKNIRTRHAIIKIIRDFFNAKDFIEIETPILTKSTPEGARDYLVPSRIYPGQFYALPQAPQQYKQILMASGFEKYYQIARVFRDEDTRGDRQPEFTQLDVEMAFTNENEVMELNEALVLELVKKISPEKTIGTIPFPKISHKDAMEKYGTDRPDLRQDKNNPNELAFAWIVDFPFFEKTENEGWTFTHNPFSAPKKEYDEDLLAKKNIGNIVAQQYDLVVNGVEIGGGSIRNHKPEMLRAVLEIMGMKQDAIKKDFGHMLRVLSSGAPPHGGIAWGLDRFTALLMNEPNIREVITFPKTGEGRDIMMNAPSEVSERQLDELRISLRKDISS